VRGERVETQASAWKNEPYVSGCLFCPRSPSVQQRPRSPKKWGVACLSTPNAGAGKCWRVSARVGAGSRVQRKCGV